MGILRNIFGPSKNEIWEKLATELKGVYTPSTFFEAGRVEVSVNSWTITLDTFTVSTGKSSTTYTRMRAPYLNKDGFRFKVKPHGFFSGIGKALGMQDVTVNQPGFDDRFVIQGSEEYKLVQLFANAEIRQLIDLQPNISFEVKSDDGWFTDKYPDGVDELYFVTVGILKDLDRLKLLFDLFAETLNHLCAIDSAYDEYPGVSAK